MRTREDKPNGGRLVILNIVNKPSQLSRNVKPRVSVERIMSETFPDDEAILCDEQRGADRVPQQEMPEDDEFPYEEQEDYDRIQRQEITDDEEILFDEQDDDN